MNDTTGHTSASSASGPSDDLRGGRPEPRIILLLPVVVATAAMVAAAVALSGDLPARIPTRWGLDGAVTATMSVWSYTVVAALVGVLVTALFVGIRERVAPMSVQRVVGGLAVGVPLALATLHVGTLLVAADAADARGFPGLVGLAALVVLVAGQLGGAALVRPVPRRTVVLDPVAIEVRPGEEVVWTTRTAAPAWLWAVLVSAAVVGVVVATVVQPVVGAVVLVVLVASIGLLSAHVTVGPAGLRVRTGPLGLVRMAVAVEDVVAVDAIDVDPLAHGGWGLRLMPGLRAVVFRRGPGIRVEQRDGPVTIVTVDGAAEAAGVLRAHVEAATGLP